MSTWTDTLAVYEARPWAGDAECANWYGVVDWFETDDEDIAIDICGACQVQIECLDYALRTRQSDGIWGGMTADERKKVRRRK